jgi:hypothetical protein
MLNHIDISHSPSFGAMPSPQMPQGIHFQDPPVNTTPPQSHLPWPPPQMTSQNIPGASSAHQSPSGDWYTKVDCLQILNNFQISHPPSPRHPQDARRLRVLRDAIEAQDWSYLTMHQHYCLLTHDPQMFPAALMLPGLKLAEKLMCDVLDSNDKLSPSYLHLFTSFPYPMQQIAAMWPAKFEHEAFLFRQFLLQTQNYSQLKTICQRRRYPPLARDLAVDLRIPSPTFQRLLFTAVLRWDLRAVLCHPRFADLEARAIALFQQNQTAYYTRHLYSPHPAGDTPEYSQNEKKYEDQFWGTKLRKLVAGFEATLQEQGLSLADIHNGVPQQPQVPEAPRDPPQRVRNTSAITNPNSMPSRTNTSIDPHSAQAAIQQSRGRSRLPTRPVQQTSVPPAHVLPSNHHPARPLLPAIGYHQPQQRVPNPARFALHQAHLRSPVLRAQSKSSPLYVFNLGYLKLPARLSTPGRAIEKWTFTLAPSDMQRMATPVQDIIGGPGAMDISESSRFARLRCVEWPESQSIKTPPESVWAVADTHWIPHSYWTFNGTPLEPRKKVHYGKDLPIDLTGLLRAGENVLEFVVLAPSGDTSHFNYLIAVEAMRVSSHESIKQNTLEKNRIPADQVLQGIKNKLAAVDDDDFMVVQSTLTIGLFDPFSQAKMCDIPVRSKACLHNDCFDLDTFLNSRPRTGDASVTDQWKCPICKSDARPQMLIVDGFIEDVKKQLESRGLTSTRHILVQQDGSWQPKAEVREGVSDDTPEPDGKRTVPADVEIIDLSD